MPVMAEERAAKKGSSLDLIAHPIAGVEPQWLQSESDRLRRLARQVGRLSLALALGLVMLLLLIGLLAGSAESWAAYVVDAVQKVPWAFFVCAGLAVGFRLAKGSTIGAVLAGALAAPAASLMSHGMAEAAHALMFDAGELGGPPPYIVALVRGCEYALLVLAIGWLARRSWSGVRDHALLGLIIGLVFGAVVFGVSNWQSPPKITTAVLVAGIINEVLFPVGCALILYRVRELAVPGHQHPLPASAA